MTSRLDYTTVAPEAYRAMLDFERQAARSRLPTDLLELVRIRASQLNRCGYCLDMHTKDARRAGELEQRLHLLSVWREAPCFSERERAALAWTEALTRLGEAGVPDQVYEQCSLVFDQVELVELSLVIVAINGWNRLGVAFRRELDP